jgi:acetyltransferase-like isoleucine patch superfamily enzyme
MDERLTALWGDLRRLREHLRERTRLDYGRLNPFYEDLFEWKERGAYWLGEDKGVTIYNSTTVVGDVSIGKNTWVGPFCSLDGTGGLRIGKNCSISAGCQLLSHDTVKWALSGGREAYEYAPVSVGDCCFLGVHAVVVKGVSIGKHCLVAAGAVVTRDVPDYSIVAGVPARVIGAVRVAEGGHVTLEYGQGPAL